MCGIDINGIDTKQIPVFCISTKGEWCKEPPLLEIEAEHFIPCSGKQSVTGGVVIGQSATKTWDSCLVV